MPHRPTNSEYLPHHVIQVRIFFASKASTKYSLEFFFVLRVNVGINWPTFTPATMDPIDSNRPGLGRTIMIGVHRQSPNLAARHVFVASRDDLGRWNTRYLNCSATGEELRGMGRGTAVAFEDIELTGEFTGMTMAHSESSDPESVPTTRRSYGSVILFARPSGGGRRSTP